MSALRRVLVAATLGAVLGAAWLLLLYGTRETLRTDFRETPPPLVTGIYPAERDQASGLTFAWTAGLLTLRLPDLDRRLPWTLWLRVRAARADPALNPDLTIHADGAVLVQGPTTTDFSDVRVTIPARPERRGVSIVIQSSQTVVPGPHDPRPLGVMLDRLELAPDGIPLPPRAALRHAALATAIAAVALAAIGSSSATIVLVALVLGGLLAAVLAHGFAPYTTYPGELTSLSLAAWGAVAAVRAVAAALGRPPSNHGRFVLAVSAAAVVLKLAVLIHPHMPVGDAMFQAHRFHDVLAGRYYFTSVAPGGYSFPYAPGLYVLATALADVVPRGPADMTLLRALVVTADALAAALLYLLFVRGGGAAAAGAAAVALYHLVPLDFVVIAVGNLTNAFAQALAAAAFALLLAPHGAGARWTIALTLTLLGAFLSHTSTFALGVVCGFLVALLFVWRGGTGLRRAGVRAGAAVALALTASVLLYYAHFTDTYRAEWSRISSETVAAAPDAGGRGVAARLAAVPRYVHLYWGVPVAALAAAGLVRLRLQPPAVHLAVAGWTLGCLAFLALGIVTPVDMRHYLAIIPPLALAAGIAAHEGVRAGGVRRVLTAVLVAWAIGIVLRAWWSTLV